MAVIMMVMVQWCGGVNDKCSAGGGVWVRFDFGGVDVVWCAASERAVGSLGVVVGDEAVEERLEVAE